VRPDETYRRTDPGRAMRETAGSPYPCRCAGWQSSRVGAEHASQAFQRNGNGVASDEDGVGAARVTGGKDHVYLVDGTGIEFLDLQPAGGQLPAPPVTETWRSPRVT